MNMTAPADGPVSFPCLQQAECWFDKLSLPDAGYLLAWLVAPVGNLNPSTGVFGLNWLSGSGDSVLTSFVVDTLPVNGILLTNDARTDPSGHRRMTETLEARTPQPIFITQCKCSLTTAWTCGWNEVVTKLVCKRLTINSISVAFLSEATTDTKLYSVQVTNIGSYLWFTGFVMSFDVRFVWTLTN
jgi:hypothetical protein